MAKSTVAAIKALNITMWAAANNGLCRESWQLGAADNVEIEENSKSNRKKFHLGVGPRRVSSSLRRSVRPDK